MDYSHLDYHHLNYKAIWTAPNWTMMFGLLPFGLQKRLDYSKWTIKIWTTPQIDYTVIWGTFVQTTKLVRSKEEGFANRYQSPHHTEVEKLFVLNENSRFL